MKKRELHCTTPKIVSYPVEGVKNPKRWYVYFRITIEGKRYIRRYSQGINEHDTFELRLKEANKLKKELINNLTNGLIPNEIFEEIEKSKKQNSIPVFEESDISLIEALYKALSERSKKLSSKSQSDYKGAVDFLVEEIKEKKWDELKLKDSSKMHFRQCLEIVKEKRKWGNRTYNNNLGYIKTILQECVDMEMIKINPMMKAPTLKQEQSSLHDPPSEKEFKRIKNQLIANHPNLWNAFCFQYHTGIRPGEILDLQLKHIDLEQRIIIIVPENNKSRTKIRYVPMNSYLYDLLINIGIQRYDNEYYLFGTPVPYGAKLPKDRTFKPNKYAIKRKTLSNLWKVLIKDELGINRTFYSGKKLSANHKIEDGMSEDALRHLFGHSSTMMTNIYITEKRNVYKNQVNNHSRKI
ncbi:site-specific integrase [Elizabethkingia miricola]|uniref:tyrosine-type recombinase/integrase n=1 Tax=Elizabethkingia TaxID=308865 RepID=UPI0010C211EC|nr:MULTISPECIES: site-specific integrase [Elizabethkingia]MCL1651783.1 site-specific integrase [Elizabethkingia miricola]QCO45831.1 site-specific integrase [Elizabethkingia sp. 2-6]WQM37631.1 site-specific integrase [Elizabethkingia miricola]